MNTETFIKEFVKIDYHEEASAYGHFPFQLASLNKDGKLTIGALFLGGDIQSCYLAAEKLLREGAILLHLSGDFPKGLDIPHDFAAVFTVEDGKVSTTAIPYNTKTGELYPLVTSGEMIRNLNNTFTKAVLEKINPPKDQKTPPSVFTLDQNTIGAFRELLTNPSAHGLNLRALKDCFEVSETATAQHILFRDYINYLRKPLPKLVFYILMTEIYGPPTGNDPIHKFGSAPDAPGCFGHYLKFKKYLNDQH
jgi:hypothetical protein